MLACRLIAGQAGMECWRVYEKNKSQFLSRKLDSVLLLVDGWVVRFEIRAIRQPYTHICWAQF